MPAYFSILFELKKGPDAIRNFCEALLHSGPSFKSGYYKSQNDSFQDILAWNQNKLNQNFQLGSAEPALHDYKQMQFSYLAFSEVRLFILNERESSVFHFNLIVPEDDLLEYVKEAEGTYSVRRKTAQMEHLKSIAKKMWVNTALLTVQTGWEGSDFPPSAEEIAGGVRPQAEPFCVLPSAFCRREPGLVYEPVGRAGVLIEDVTKWDV